MTGRLRCELCGRVADSADIGERTTCPQAFTFGRHIWKSADEPELIDLGWTVSAAEVPAPDVARVELRIATALHECLAGLRAEGIDVYADRIAR